MHKAQKAFTLASDGVILDLEDAVALNEKDKARQLVTRMIEQTTRKNVFVRINSLSTPFAFRDLQDVVRAKPHGLMIPKIDSKRDVEIVDWILDQLEKQYAILSGQTEIIPLIESASGIENVLQIVSASPRIKRLAFGALDFTADLGAYYSKSGEEVMYARSRIVIASRAAGREGPIDTPFPDVKDIDGLIKDTALAKQLGFSGKLVIHPSQIEPVCRVFVPSLEEVELARQIVVAYEAAKKKGFGVFQLDGKMVDAPILRHAQQIMELASAQSY